MSHLDFHDIPIDMVSFHQTSCSFIWYGSDIRHVRSDESSRVENETKTNNNYIAHVSIAIVTLSTGKHIRTCMDTVIHVIRERSLERPRDTLLILGAVMARVSLIGKPKRRLPTAKLSALHVTLTHRIDPVIVYS